VAATVSEKIGAIMPPVERLKKGRKRFLFFLIGKRYDIRPALLDQSRLELLPVFATLKASQLTQVRRYARKV